MKITEHIKKTKKTLFSFEILPPLKGQNIEELYGSIDELIECDPAFINVTYHREESVYKKLPNGLLEEHSVRKRPGTVGICAAIGHKYNIDVVPHIICGGFNKEETENALIDLNYLGINNIVALRGDARRSDKNFIPQVNGHKYASGLIEQVNKLNKGQYLDEEQSEVHSTDFCIGVAGYPEKHSESPNMKSDIYYLKRKVELGADYIVTQMFFDNQKFFDFSDKCREAGITVPIIPGLKPLSFKSQLNSIPKTFHVDIPDKLSRKIIKCSSKEDIQKVSEEWGVEQANELISKGVPVLHYYTMGKSGVVRNIVKEVLGS
ncbi:MAG: methylenetetrahydrofolate reductase (NADPH) [Flavobacteriales bacterium]|jgi:methylenetetrahydrofolate reductase (NADPH)